MEYFRNFKARGQTNNQEKKKKNLFKMMCFEGKELRIKNNDQESIPRSPREKPVWW